MEQYQYLGWAALALYLIGPLFRTPRNSIKMVTVGESLNVILYALSMQWVGALSIFLNVVRSLCAIYASDKVLKYVLIFSLAIVWAAALYYIKYPYDIIIACCATCIAMAQRNRDNFYGYRLFAMSSQCLWVLHSLITGMHTMAVSCSLLAAINLATVLYYSYKAYQNTGSFIVRLDAQKA